ncbi:MAG: STAS domain-containing protein [Candidatus Eremiobacteraeota bacterium]|nr:STAS domain-containing protein [Candidatus Eremiobacteraeota bacterium]MBV8669494.1 STAS domain-containing protein [Candidatus Eremiobacteraeota bacterium]
MRPYADKLEIVALEGELDVARKQEIRDALQLRPGARAVLVDLTGVSYADSTALSELLRFCLEARRDAVAAAVLVTAPQLVRLIDLAGLTAAFNVFNDRNKALSYLQSGS